jgi:Fic family protein
LAELNQRYGGLPSPKEAQAIWEDIWHQEAHHSTALEGNTLVFRQVQALLDQGRAIGAKPLSEYNEVRGYADAAQWVYGQAPEPGDWHDGRLLTIAEVRQVHHTAMTPVWDVAPHLDATDREGPGSFREHDIRPFGGGMTPPSWPLVPAQVQHWVKSACRTGDKIHAGEDLGRPLVEELARLHNEFERVHPFIDGNGRAGRLVLNLILVRLGHPPVVVFKRQRNAYLAATQRADRDDFGALGELIARAMYDNLNGSSCPTSPDQLAWYLWPRSWTSSSPFRRSARRRNVGVLMRSRALMASGGVLARPSTPTASRGTSDEGTPHHPNNCTLPVPSPRA